ncbi:MAG: hypothetical protein ACXV5R_10170 [Candidatus Angelobacter sp.]
MHASIPALKSSSLPSADVQFEKATHGRPAVALTAAPADISFYEEFYPSTAVRQEQPKTSVLHWFGSLIKKAVRR